MGVDNMKMPKHLNLLIIEGMKTVGVANCLGYIEERLTMKEHDKVKTFLTYLHKNKLTVGWGNIEDVWEKCFKKALKKAKVNKLCVLQRKTRRNDARFPKEDWYTEVRNGDTLLGYNEWLLHKTEAAQDEAQAIIKSYPNGLCPDCSRKIPKTVTEGDACKTCGHVFNQEV
jgi:hypothetical protein